MASCLVVEGRVGNCSQQSQGLYLSEADGDSVVVTSGLQTTLSSAIDGVVQPDSFFINFTTLGFAERDKFDSEHLEGVCATPSGFGSTPFDPVASQGPASPIRRYHDVHEFDCFIYSNERIINNTNIKGNFVKYSRDDYPGWETTLSFEYAESDVTQVASDDTTYTFGHIYSFSWPANKVKITADIVNFPWSEPVSSSNLTTQFLSLHFDLGIVLRPGGQFYFEDTKNDTTIVFNTTDQRLDISFEKISFVDGIPFAANQKFDYPPVILHTQELSNLNGHFGVEICDNNVGQWKHAIYDPKISTIFLSPREDEFASPTTKKSNKIVVSIVVPIVAVLTVAAIVTAGVVILKSPTLRDKILPYRARSEARTASTTTKSSQTISQATPTTDQRASGWTPSQRPTL
jgi:hypothetical protein